MSDAAGVGLLNLVLRLTSTGKSDEVSPLEYSRLVKKVPPGATPEAAAREILEGLGDRGAAARKALGGGSAGSSIPGPSMLRKTGGVKPPSSAPAAAPAAAAAPAQSSSPAKSGPGKLGDRAKLFAAADGDAAEAPVPAAGPPQRSVKPKADFGSTTMPAINRAPLEKAQSSGKWDGPAMYLTYEPAQNGILFAVYSQTPVNGAIAYAKPGKPIPAFKFQTLGAKLELVKGASDQNAFMRGVAAFVKASKQHNSSIDLNETGGLFPCAVYIHYGTGNKVAKVAPGALTSTEGLDAVACVPQQNTDLKGISVMDKAMFVQRGDSFGGTAS